MNAGNYLMLNFIINIYSGLEKEEEIASRSIPTPPSKPTFVGSKFDSFHTRPIYIYI